MKNTYLKAILISAPIILNSMSAVASDFSRNINSDPVFEGKINDFVLRFTDAQGNFNKKIYLSDSLRSHPDKGGDAKDQQAINEAKKRIDDKGAGKAREDAVKAQAKAKQKSYKYYGFGGDGLKEYWTKVREAEAKAKAAAEAERINTVKKHKAKTAGVSRAFHDMLGSNSNMIENRFSAVEVSGDEVHKDRVWVKGFGGVGKSKGTQISKNQHLGATIGVDCAIADNDFVGFAFTYGVLKTAIQNNGNVNAEANIASIYSYFTPGNSKFFILSHLSAGHATINNLTYSQSKHKANLLKAKIGVGYKFDLENNVSLTPKIGVAYNSVNIKDSKKYLLINQDRGFKTNFVVTKDQEFKTNSVVTDVALSLDETINLTNNTIVPEIHIGLIYGEKVVIESEVSKLTKESKTNKLSYNLGGSIKAINTSKIDLMLGYDCNFNKSYRGHNGFVKIAFNF